jgi:hypothetical protein
MKQVNLLSHLDAAPVKRTVVETEPNRAERSSKENNEKLLGEVVAPNDLTHSKAKKLLNLASNSQHAPVYAESKILLKYLLKTIIKTEK